MESITQFRKQTTHSKFIVIFFNILCEFIVASQKFLFATVLTE